MLQFLCRRDGRRREADPPAIDVAVHAFWQRWATLRSEVAAALEADQTDLIEPQLAAAVGALDRRLGWSVGSGERTRYALMITGEGDNRLRALTDAWLAAAPADDHWEYHDAAPPHDDPSEIMLAIGDHQIALADIRVAAQPVGDLVHVAVFHPLMAQLTGADRDAVSFVPLDVTLGERLVERRIGRVDPVDREPDGSLDLVGLRALVTGMDDRSIAARVG